MSFIELGDVTSAPGFEPAARTHRGSPRRFAVVAVLLLTLLTLAGSVRPPPSGLRPLWTTPMSEADGLLLGSGTAYVNRNTADTVEVAAYDLATGRRQWEVSVDAPNGDLRLAEAAGLLLLTADLSPYFRRVTIALDVRTGRRLWITSGLAEQIIADTALMVDYTNQGAAYRMRLLRLTDRTEIWTRDTPGLHEFSVADDKIVTTTMDGHVDVLRLADAARLAGAPVRWIKPVPEQNRFDSVTVAGAFLVVTRNWQNNGDVTVYRLDTLTEAWRQAGIGDGYVFRCGPALCICTGPLLTAYALATGVRLWQWPGVSNPWAADDNRVIADRGDDSLVLIDPASGAPIGTPVRGGTTVWTVEPADDIYVLHPSTSPPNRTSITRWEVATGHSRVLGTLDLLTGYRCQIKDRYLACNRDAHLEVTALR